MGNDDVFFIFSCLGNLILSTISPFLFNIHENIVILLLEYQWCLLFFCSGQ
jgi:hypothetical protein